MPLFNENPLVSWHTFTTTDEQGRLTAQAMLHAMRQDFAGRVPFHISLLGSTTPRKMHESLRYGADIHAAPIAPAIGAGAFMDTAILQYQTA
jgi:hypothetical protein